MRDSVTGKISSTGILRLSDNACIPINDENIDYREYLKWVAEGNTILPPEGE